jgi:hypothetical protein
MAPRPQFPKQTPRDDARWQHARRIAVALLARLRAEERDATPELLMDVGRALTREAAALRREKRGQ